MSKKKYSGVLWEFSPALASALIGNGVFIAEEHRKEFYALVDWANKRRIKYQ